MLLYLIPVMCNYYAIKAQVNPSFLISEILFNPARDGFDYVELLNANDSALNLNGFLLANRNSAGDPASMRRISTNDFWVEPQQLVVITPNRKWLSQNYHLPDTAKVCEVSSMPSFPDDEGNVLILRRTDSSVCDELQYNEDWHFALIDEPSGVALERITYRAATQNRHSWTSASSASGYGTPGYRNSQSAEISTGSEASFAPKVFTPDNDGVDDFSTLSLKTDLQGAVANALIFDASGRRIRYFLKNEVLGGQNLFRWDGLDDDNRLCPPGLYIIVTTVFDLRGQVRKFRNVVAVAYSQK